LYTFQYGVLNNGGSVLSVRRRNEKERKNAPYSGNGSFSRHL
jgi:hypothetical protein